ncbi:Di-copper centre-containing protein [Lindgomyces ingoldianus]|uniref:Di-copper centre-containing protein n=1 Tax=Lindgomyces ingoldianus TaxID=673940 RepID=A0ACB6R1D7_9PLEO|nr:Di-copper centre-containing protein [Lindgomyces ingoldianus]KAF2473068.1 Di-copper centre-containing protein [Lindgomyces ingoldianus]
MVSSTLSFLVLITATTLAAAVPHSRLASRASTCTTKSQRKSWTTLTNTEKAAYIEAELCLMNSPTKGFVADAVSRWDDLTWAHLNQSNYIHDVGQFLPWHRYFMYTHEYLLKTECNYTGTQPYWDEEADSDALVDSDVFDPDTGFGGNGVSSNTSDYACIADGPFVNVTLAMGPEYTNTNHCIYREFSATSFMWANSTYLDQCMAEENYTSAYPCFSSWPHTSGHAGVGGSMLDIVASPGEPLFFLHHTNLDRLWWIWQSKNLTTRLTDMGGQNIPDDDYLASMGMPYPDASLTNYSGDPGNVTTLTHVLWMSGLVPNVTVGDVMDIGGDLLCFEYV